VQPQTAITAPIQLRVASTGRVDRYRLCRGRLEFLPSGSTRWRVLEYPEIEQHLQLDTPLARWLGRMNTIGVVARFLATSWEEQAA
jgi:hypothetical protein